jgi:hypothetical protein
MFTYYLSADFVARATCSSFFFENFENNILKFQINLKKPLDVGNDVFYQRAHSELENPYT